MVQNRGIVGSLILAQGHFLILRHYNLYVMHKFEMVFYNSLLKFWQERERICWKVVSSTTRIVNGTDFLVPIYLPYYLAKEKQ